MIGYNDLLKLRSPDGIFKWSDREAILYALAIGMASDPTDRDELDFVYEKNLRVVPTFATVAAWGSNPPIRYAVVNYQKVLHAAQEVLLHRPLPATASVIADGRIVSAIDKGDKGALVEGETVVRDAATGEPYFSNRVTWFARDDGHFGGPRNGGASPHPMPDRAPDRVIEIGTRTDQAALYRLLGDRNPLHIDPDVARRAGFDRPILHGLCTFGITCRAILLTYAKGDVDRIASHAVRFTGPVFPGDVLAIELWIDGEVVSFEVRVPVRDVVVIRNGRTVLR